MKAVKDYLMFYPIEGNEGQGNPESAQENDTELTDSDFDVDEDDDSTGSDDDLEDELEDDAQNDAEDETVVAS